MLTLLKTLYKWLWFELIWLSGVFHGKFEIRIFLVMNSKSRIWNLENILENTNSSCSKLMLAQVHLLAFPVQHRPSLLKLMHLWPKLLIFLSSLIACQHNGNLDSISVCYLGHYFQHYFTKFIQQFCHRRLSWFPSWLKRSLNVPLLLTITIYKPMVVSLSNKK